MICDDDIYSNIIDNKINKKKKEDMEVIITIAKV